MEKTTVCGRGLPPSYILGNGNVKIGISSQFLEWTFFVDELSSERVFECIHFQINCIHNENIKFNLQRRMQKFVILND